MRIVVAARDQAARIALLSGDLLIEYAIWDRARPDGVGDVYTGRVTAKAPAMAGCFVELGGETGFLPDSAGRPEVGQYLAVTVGRAAQGGKGPRLAVAAELPADRPGLIRRGAGPLIELAARFPEADVLVDDYAWLAELRPSLGGRAGFLDKTFEPVLEDEVAALAEPCAALPDGAVMHVAPTPALTAIDIDGGGATAAAAPKTQAQLALNLAVIPELARQIVLRNLSGAILIDFAGMKPKARAALLPTLAAALTADPLRPRLLGLTALGFAEIVRPRVRPPLHELLDKGIGGA